MGAITISKILKVREFDLSYLKLVPGNYYACRDTHNFYQDTQNNKRVRISVIFVATELNRVYKIAPVNGKLYYVWETNTLWTFTSNKWVVKEDNGYQKASGYYYKDNTLYPTGDEIIVDNNGLLKDGSVVVRDLNRNIKGKLYIDESNNNLVISSFLGGGLRFLPNGSSDTPGALIINPNFDMSVRDNDNNELFPSYLADEIVNNYVSVRLEEMASERWYEDNDTEPSDSDIANIISLMKSENPLISQEIMSERFETVRTQVEDGYMFYNGQLNLADDIYIHKTLIDEVLPNGDLSARHVVHRVLTTGDVYGDNPVLKIDDGCISDSIIYD